MEALAAKYTANLPPPPPNPHPFSAQSHTTSAPEPIILLTGSTGFLGSYILSALLSTHPNAKIYCLNRPSRPTKSTTTLDPDLDPSSRQQHTSSSRDLHKIFPPTVKFLTADLAAPFLGLERPVYEDLARKVTCVIHNAWHVNFLSPVEKFEPLIAGTRNLVDFCIYARQGGGRHPHPSHPSHPPRSDPAPTLFFISTLGVGLKYPLLTPSPSPPLPERLLSFKADPELGYARAKIVAEYILSEASRVSGIKTVICRVGQIAGPTDVGSHPPGSRPPNEMGGWNKKEWFPSLLASSLTLGCLPRTLGAAEEVSWVPVDVVAGVIVELALGMDAEEGEDGGGKREEEEMEILEQELWDREGRRTTYVTGDEEKEEEEEEELLRPTPANCTILHISSPTATTYTALLPTILALLPAGIKVVDYPAWLTRLQTSSPEVADNPARRLIDLFASLGEMHAMGKEMVKLDTTGTVLKSEKLRDMQPVSAEWMEGWMRGWGYVKETRARL